MSTTVPSVGASVVDSGLRLERAGELRLLATADRPVLLCRPPGFGKSNACSALKSILKSAPWPFEGLPERPWEPCEVQ
jgi:hypothetical protein